MTTFFVSIFNKPTRNKNQIHAWCRAIKVWIFVSLDSWEKNSWLAQNSKYLFLHFGFRCSFTLPYSSPDTEHGIFTSNLTLSLIPIFTNYNTLSLTQFNVWPSKRCHLKFNQLRLDASICFPFNQIECIINPFHIKFIVFLTLKNAFNYMLMHQYLISLSPVQVPYVCIHELISSWKMGMLQSLVRMLVYTGRIRVTRICMGMYSFQKFTSKSASQLWQYLQQFGWSLVIFHYPDMDMIAVVDITCPQKLICLVEFFGVRRMK